MNTEDLIREALALQADRAPDHRSTLAKLQSAWQPNATPVRRCRPTMLTIAASFVTAVALPVVIFTGYTGPAPATDKARPPSFAETSSPVPQHPPWLPALDPATSSTAHFGCPSGYPLVQCAW